VNEDVVLCVGEPLIALSALEAVPLSAATTLRVSTGGAELNVAVHLARLGVPTRFAGQIGDDPWGRMLSETLEHVGVDTSSLRVHPTRPTGCYLKDSSTDPASVYYYRADSAASLLESLPDDVFRGVRRVHLSGITAALSPQCARLSHDLLDGADRAGRTTSFDINYRPALWSPSIAGSVLLDLAMKATTVFTGLDEATTLWGCTSVSDVRRLLPEVAELVVKDGPREATVFAGDSTVSLKPEPVEVVDIVGAGDAFAAGYLASRWSGANLLKSLAGGHSIAASVIASSHDNGWPSAPQLAAPDTALAHFAMSALGAIDRRGDGLC
jgi:2-dehydro-3-deoxygluconokinase